MQKDKAEFIIQYLKKSDEALKDAEITIEHDRLENALSRLYYALFYSVTALAYLHGYSTSKHHQLLGWFNKKFIYEEKSFAPEDYLVYKEAFENRQNADYSIFTSFTLNEVSNNLQSIRSLVKKIGDHIKNQLKNQ
jgi:uncharacterized protein (UPF0332 family)